MGEESREHRGDQDAAGCDKTRCEEIIIAGARQNGIDFAAGLGFRLANCLGNAGMIVGANQRVMRHPCLSLPATRSAAAAR
ncbi:hypothetical protein DK64_2465 [Brucella neotomae 5K33]|nr:hypothetical protein DK64_2465 [Brucella neotomae 5K33]SPU68952.1 Uncharacterised protein [Brucella neotomae]SUW41212.1 Uncharacterised protein [Brucella neotomae]